MDALSSPDPCRLVNFLDFAGRRQRWSFRRSDFAGKGDLSLALAGWSRACISGRGIADDAESLEDGKICPRTHCSHCEESVPEPSGWTAARTCRTAEARRHGHEEQGSTSSKYRWSSVPDRAGDQTIPASLHSALQSR